MPTWPSLTTAEASEERQPTRRAGHRSTAAPAAACAPTSRAYDGQSACTAAHRRRRAAARTCWLLCSWLLPARGSGASNVVYAAKQSEGAKASKRLQLVAQYGEATATACRVLFIFLTRFYTSLTRNFPQFWGRARRDSHGGPPEPNKSC